MKKYEKRSVREVGYESIKKTEKKRKLRISV